MVLSYGAHVLGEGTCLVEAARLLAGEEHGDLVEDDPSSCIGAVRRWVPVALEAVGLAAEAAGLVEVVPVYAEAYRDVHAVGRSYRGRGKYGHDRRLLTRHRDDVSFS